jgi:hypothetical protein
MAQRIIELKLINNRMKLRGKECSTYGEALQAPHYHMSGPMGCHLRCYSQTSNVNRTRPRIFRSFKNPGSRPSISYLIFFKAIHKHKANISRFFILAHFFSSCFPSGFKNLYLSLDFCVDFWSCFFFWRWLLPVKRYNNNYYKVALKVTFTYSNHQRKACDDNNCDIKFKIMRKQTVAWITTNTRPLIC